ncbi:BTB/POZ domain-containing protein 8-like isoform X1 [Mytilus edulis]|uniref:BTB/POZ domain-containing protein 8-like isoform X1 n=2 Tax=Mytilus edulis TaxID=6550 RepID=UPI0039EE51CB
MARPKEKIPSSKTKTFLERCQHEKDNLKQSVIKQLQKDLGSLLHNEEHSDLMIRAEGKEVKVHKFILKSRCPAVFDRFLELSTGEDSDVLVMPSWVTYKTVLFIVRKLYFVETEPLDETVDKQDEILMDYLKSLLFQHQTVASNGCEKSNNQHQITIEAENGENDISNNQCENHADIANSNLCQKETTSQIKQEGEPSHGGASEEDLTINSMNNVNNLEKIHKDSQIGNGCVNSGEINNVQSSFSDMIKLSYGLTLPYETCNRVGEDLLRGYLQESYTDCQITVSGDHFKVHKCILSSRSSYFAAMLGGAWRETESDINLEGVSPSVVEQLLLYLYGGVVDLMESCAVEEFIMTADMYGLEGIKTVVVSYLKRDYCHMFHKLCPGCEELLPEALTIAVAFRMDPLRDRCVDWINRNVLKTWRSKSLAKQPQEVLDVCYQKAVDEMNEESVFEILLNCENLNQNVQRLRWCEPLLCLITKVNDSAIEFISCNFVQVLNSSAFYKLDKGLGYKISLLKDIFDVVIKSLPINKACEAYHSLLLNCIQIKEVEEEGVWSQDFCDFITFLFQKCEDFLKLHVHQVINTPGWDLLSKDTQAKLLQGGNFVVLKNPSPDPKKLAKARTVIRRNYIPVLPVRKTTKVKAKTVSKPKDHGSTTHQSIPTDQNNGNDTKRRETTHDQSENTGEATASGECAVGGDLEVLGAGVQMEAPVIDQLVYNVELAEATDFTIEIIPILNFTFHRSQDY